LVRTFPAPYGDEMIGIAAATQLPLGDIVLFNVFYEVFTVCTSIVSQDANGNILHARNLDFGLLLGWDYKNNTWMISDLLRPTTINVNFTRNGQLLYITAGFAGFIGVFSGVKPVGHNSYSSLSSHV
jgi:acid ceramidase